jgi:hypothetical protein
MINIKKKTLMWSLVAALVVGVGFVAAADENSLFVKAADGPYTLTLDENNGKITGAYSTDEQVNSDAKTNAGNAFSVTYCDVMESTYTNYTYAQLKKKYGYIYSTNGVKGLTSVTVTFHSSSSPSIYFSDSKDFSDSTATTLTSGTTVTTSQNFFKIAAASNALYIGSIVLTYTCDGATPTPTKTVSSIAVKTQPTKTSYTVGDALDTTGLVLTATYSDESTADISTGFTCSPTSLSTAGTQTITVTYGGATATFTVTVTKAAPIGTYELVTSADQLVAGNTYVIGSTNEAGTAYFCGNSETSTYYTTPVSETINSDLTMTPSDTIEEYSLGGTAGAWTFTSTKHTTNGYLAGTSSHASLYIQSGATSYYTYSISVTSAGLATVKNNDNTIYPYMEYYSGSSRFSLYSDSSQTVALFTSVNSASAPALTLSPTSLSLNKGGSDGSISCTTDSGATLAVTSSNTSAATASLSGTAVTVHPVAAGTSTITVTATKDSVTSKKTCLVTVTEPALEVSAVELTIEGTGVSDSTTTVTAEHFNSTISYTVTSSNTAVATGAIADGKLTVTSGNAYGTATLTISATDGATTLTATVAVTVKAIPTISSIAVTTNPTTTSYTVNDTFSTTGMVVTATYSDSSTKVVTGWTTDTPDMTTTGTKTVTVTYGSFTTTFTITVNAATLSSIAVTTKPTTLSYQQGDTLDLTGMVVTATYSDSSTAVVTGYTTSPANGATLSTSGTTTVTVTYSGKTASFTITVASTSSQAAWTIMIYMGGADLESNGQTSASSASGYATGDLTEIYNTKSSLPDNVNIIVEAGGAKCWKSTYSSVINKSYLNRFHLTTSGYVKDAQITKANMGLSSTYESFLEWGLTSYPADRTMVIMWDHGGAMSGCCYDENYSSDSLSNAEVKSALTSAFSAKGRTSNLEVMGYDACLMSVQDIAEFNSSHFNYMIASEESEAGNGWDYDGGWLAKIYANPTTVATSTVLTDCCDQFITDNGGASSSSNDQTLAWMDLSKAAAYKTAWEDMSSYLSSSVLTSSNKSSFVSLVKGCKYYAGTDYTYFSTFDAKDFLTKLVASSTFNTGSVSTYVSSVKTAFANLVQYSTCGKGAGNSHGLCLFFAVSSNVDSSTSYASSETNFTNWRSINSTYGA